MRPHLRNERAEQEDGQRRAERADEIHPPAAARGSETEEQEAYRDRRDDPPAVGDQRDGGERGEESGCRDRAHGTWYLNR